MLDHLRGKWNVYTHGFGIGIILIESFGFFPISLIGFWQVWGFYLFFMVFLFSASSIYHGIKLKYQAFGKDNHIAIYLLMLGYTPVT